MELAIVLLILFALFVGLPALQHRRQESARVKIIRQLEKQRRSRVVTLIHRQERLSFLGIPFLRFINVEDAEQILRAVRLTPAETPIDLIIHTPGGLVLPAQQIAYALKRHPARVTVMIPHYAMSGGTLIALAADEILLDANAVLGSVDPQVSRKGEVLPASSILAVFQIKDRDQMDDSTIMLADVAAKAIRQMRDFVRYLLEDRMGADRAQELARTLTGGGWTHDYPLTAPMLQGLDLPVRTELPPEVYRLMELYPQPMQRRPSVQYVPIPYRRDDEEDSTDG